MSSPDAGRRPRAPINRAELRSAVGAHHRGQLSEAETAYRAILLSEPEDFDALHLLGVVLFQRGELAESEAMLRRAIATDPNVASAHSNLGNTLEALGRPHESLACYDRAIALDRTFADAFSNRANVLDGLGRRDEALAGYDRAIELNPEYVDALGNRAALLVDAGRFEEALASCDRALALNPGSVDILQQRGTVLLHLKRPGEALDSLDRALAIDPSNIASVSNRSIALDALGRSEEAIAGFDRALALKPDLSEALTNKARILKSLGRIDEACDTFQKAIAVAPDCAEAHSDFGMTLLLNGDFDAGWREFEYRWLKTDNVGNLPDFGSPAWTGEALGGRSIVVYAEQGLGDIVQFCRYLPLLKQRGATVCVLVAARMHAILRAAFPEIPLLADISQVETHRFDFHCAMMSLPLHFQTTLASIPATVPYLKSDPGKTAMWRKKIGSHGFRVGICWQGNPNGDVDIGRSIPLEAFAPLGSVADVRLISLQKNDGVIQLECLKNELKVETLGPNFDSGPDAFVDTLAAMENVDLVITSDTSIAHVAGALARPVWVALKNVPDWRWMLNREDCPWYPTMRLFRQDARDNWPGVFARMRKELATPGIWSRRS
jgi:tetratricopeptide (TPR) repeat protein